MFTGIITDVGTIRSVEKRGDTRFVLNTAYDVDTIELGASIACSGVCLTVVAKGRDHDGGWFAVDASAETLNCSNLGEWAQGHPVNLERALKVGDELGGHIVSGHVDGLGTIEAITPDGDSKRFRFACPADLLPLISDKGSITVDGVSLTVNRVDETGFEVNIIPHTQAVTSFAHANPGDPVNLEVDVLARYVARIHQAQMAHQPPT